MVVGELGGGAAAQGAELLLVEFLERFGLGGEVEHDPCAGRGGGVLACHQEPDHHVGDLGVWEWAPVFVAALHQVPDHVFAVFFGRAGAAGLDDVGVELGHFSLADVSSAVPR